VAKNQRGIAEAGMGTALGDIDRDGHLDLLVTNLTGEGARLYSGLGDGTFEDQVAQKYPGQISRMHTGWGTALVDLNHDGDIDLPIVNGLVVPCYSRFPYHGEDKFVFRQDVIPDPAAYWREYMDANLLFLGEGLGRLREDVVAGGDFTAALGSGRALIHGDVDNDGDVDLLVTNCGGRARLYRNSLPKAGHWLLLRVFDPQHNRDALGAELVVTAGRKSWRNVVHPASSYLASNDLRVHFGLGATSRYDHILVRWPDGPLETASEVFAGGEADQSVVLRRGEGRLIREPR
jgi:hypothetical protein